MCRSNWLLRHTSNNLSLVLKLIGYKSKSHLLKVDFSLLLAKLLHQWVSHIVHGVYSLYLDILLFEIIIDKVESSLNVLKFLMRSHLFSKSYGIVVITE